MEDHMRLSSLGVLVSIVSGPVFAESVTPPTELVYEGKTYRLVTGVSLKTMLAGHEIVWRRCVDTGRCTDTFAADGSAFVRSGDRMPFMRGIYSVVEDHYCMTLYPKSPGSFTNCKALLRSDDGEIVEITFWNGQRWGPNIVDVRSPTRN